ncbi:MAG: arylsulfatase A-like enzyme [Alcanivorax sp.]|jgi:arylsulfatase A-like enzyme
MKQHFALGLIALLLSVISVQSHSRTQPNILLIYVDDLGYGDLGSYGHPIIKTPHLDKLASDGLRLTNYYAPSALCSPSRAAVLTGRTPYRTGIKSWIPENSNIFLRKNETTLAELFKSQGYETALIGKWHLNSDLGNEAEPQPLDHGFDYAYGHNAFQIPTNHNPTNIFRNGKSVGEVIGYTADIYADEAIRWLEDKKPETSFFMFLSMAEPHSQFENPAEYNKMYAEFTQGEVVPIPSGEKSIPIDNLVARGPGEYYANITYMDAQLGRVFQALDQLSSTQNTIVVFASDNGPVTSDWRAWWEINAHGSTGGLRGRKHGLYEGGIKVPAIIRYPGVIPRGTESAQIITGMDLFPTLANLVGAHVPSDRPIDGIDIAAVFTGGKLESRTLFWAMPTDSNVEYVVREGPWKLLSDKDLRSVALFNLDNDPYEFFNLIQKESVVLKKLEDQMAEMIRSISKDPLRISQSVKNVF